MFAEFVGSKHFDDPMHGVKERKTKKAVCKTKNAARPLVRRSFAAPYEGAGGKYRDQKSII